MRFRSKYSICVEGLSLQGLGYLISMLKPMLRGIFLNSCRERERERERKRGEGEKERERERERFKDGEKEREGGRDREDIMGS